MKGEEQKWSFYFISFSSLLPIMKCPSCSSIQRSIMAFVNASPIILLLVIFIWSYWAYNFSLCYNLVSEGHGVQGKQYPRINAKLFTINVGSLYILFYHPLFILCMWSYWTVCRTSPGYTLDVRLNQEKRKVLNRFFFFFFLPLDV